MGAYYLYILALEEGYYYVGISRDVYHRYSEHCNKKGAHFTWIHHPKGLICSRELSTWRKEEAEEEETKMTLLMMKAFGVDRVRGGKYFQADINDVRKRMGERLYLSLVSDHKSSDREQLLKNYPEIRFGLELFRRHIAFPVNISSYHIWPSKSYYDKAIEQNNKGNIRQIMDYYMTQFLDLERSGRDGTRAFQEMVKQVIDRQGYFEIYLKERTGKETHCFLDKNSSIYRNYLREAELYC